MTAINHKPDVQSAPVRWGTLADLTSRYPFSRTRAYRLLAAGKLRAKKLDGRTIFDFQSADELLASLPDFERAA